MRARLRNRGGGCDGAAANVDLISGKHRRPHFTEVPGDPEEPEGADQISGENQQADIGQPRRDLRRQHLRPRLDKPDRRPYQHPPGQGEGQADPPPEISRDPGVVPETDAQKALPGPERPRRSAPPSPWAAGPAPPASPARTPGTGAGAADSAASGPPTGRRRRRPVPPASRKSCRSKNTRARGPCDHLGYSVPRRKGRYPPLAPAVFS